MIIIISADGEERGVDRLDGEGRFDPRSVEDEAVEEEEGVWAEGLRVLRPG